MCLDKVPSSVSGGNKVLEMVRHAKTFEVTATRGKANAVLSASDGSGGKKTFKFDKLAIERNGFNFPLLVIIYFQG